jgi:hypothetical protein
MAVRSTSPGANNRLDLEALYSYDLELDRATVLDGNVAAAGNGGSGGDHDVDAPLPANGIAHKRGLSSCVFVPWEQVRRVGICCQPPDRSADIRLLNAGLVNIFQCVAQVALRCRQAAPF